MATQKASRKEAPSHPLDLHPKVAAGSIGALAGTVLLWGLGLAGFNPPPNVAGAIAGLFGVGLAYFAPWMASDLAPSGSGAGAIPGGSVTQIGQAAG